MKLEQQLKLELDPAFESVEEMEPGSAYGVIYINDFYEHFYMSSSWWSLADYQRQWQMAFERLRMGKDACFVVNVQCHTPLVATWLAYCVGKKIYIQNQYFFGAYYKQVIGRKSFTPESSFDFIPERETHCDDGDPISEWEIELDKEA